MSPVPVFVGFVNEAGKLTLDNRHGFIQHTRSFAGKEVEVTIRKRRSQRSLDQNAYWHAAPFALFAEEWGVSIEDAKLLLMGECFGWHEVQGHRLPVRIHTSQLTTEEAVRFTDWMVTWGATEWGMVIPLPNEVAA